MLKTTVENIMTENVVMINEKATVMEAAHILLRFKINGILVVKKDNRNEVMGVLTTTDLLKLLNKALSSHGHKIKELEKVGKLLVKDVINGEVIKVQKDTKLEKVIAIMHRKNIHTIPVYSNEKLVGVIGRHDILNIAFHSARTK